MTLALGQEGEKNKKLAGEMKRLDDRERKRRGTVFGVTVDVQLPAVGI